MLDLKNSRVKNLIFQGNFGLEKESLRVTADGQIAQTPHPFMEEKHIVRDFSESQTEINTGVCPTAEAAVKELEDYTQLMHRRLDQMNPKEYLWPNSNPPYIRQEEDIPIAVYGQDEIDKAVYREYLSVRYGRYKMCYSGIHVNFSFGEELIQAGFLASGMQDIREYRDRLYLKLAENLASYGWVVTAITAASADMDGSFFERGVKGKTTFFGMATVRCSELGYWNQFVPILDYSSLASFVKSIRRYCDKGFIAYPSELYYPVRLKPRGENKLEALEEYGVDHIELRNVDLNPLTYAGFDVRDLKFIHLLLIWLINIPRIALSEADQIQVVQNFKNAARFDLNAAYIVSQSGKYATVAEAGRQLIAEMKTFYMMNFMQESHFREIMDILSFEEEKFIYPERRYAAQLHEDFGERFFEKNLEIAKRKQEI